MKQPKALAVSLALMLAISGCTKTNNAPEADPAYISPTHYSDFNCNQISAEMQRVSAKLDQAEQSDMASEVLGTAFAVFAMTKGYSVDNGSDNVTTRRLRNQYDVLEQTAIRKECSQ